ncbi:MAG TPA: hypothetical protein VM163_01120, partial [bacterium]|nr:hypothetical protein [bacterium]
MAEDLSNRHRLSARLDQRLTQKLVLTPQMRQSLEMLQMNVLELEQKILAELTENPLLEEVSDLEKSPEEDATPTTDPEDESLDEVMSLLLKRKSDDGPDEDEFRVPVIERWRGDSDIVDPAVYERILFKRENLADHLMDQLHLDRLSADDFKIAERIIGNIDSDGFLRVPLKLIAGNAKVDVEKVRQILRLIQEFDPPGVGAKDLRECLKIQLRNLFAEHEVLSDTAPFSKRLWALVQKAIDAHFGLLVGHKYAELRKALRISDSTLKSIVSLIETLEPRPGSAFDLESGIPVVPDVYVVKHGSRFVPILNEQKLPRLRIVRNYQESLGVD